MKEITMVGFVQTIFFSILVLSKKDKSLKDYLLTLFFLLVGCELIYRYLLFYGIEQDNKWMIIFDIVYWALFGPVTFIYFFSVTGQIKKFSLKHSIHLLPLFISIIMLFDFLFLTSENQSFLYYFGHATGLSLAAIIIWEFASPVYLFYLVYVLFNHKKRTKKYFSSIKNKDFKWLLLLIAGFSVYLLTSYSFMLLRIILKIDVGFVGITYLPIILTAYVFIMGYFGYKQENLFFVPSINHKGALAKPSKTSCTNREKYLKSSLSDEEKKDLIVNLESIMLEEKPFLDSEINLGDLAEKLDTTFHKLSQIINESMNMNFYDFINSHRVEAAKKMLSDPESKKLKVMSIAFDSGFSSKSAFYNAFRKHAACTPTQFRDTVLEENKEFV